MYTSKVQLQLCYARSSIWKAQRRYKMLNPIMKPPHKPFKVFGMKQEITPTSISDFVADVKSENVSDILVNAKEGLIFYTSDYEPINGNLLSLKHVTEFINSEELWKIILNSKRAHILVDNSIEASKHFSLSDFIGVLMSIFLLLYIIRVSTMASIFNRNGLNTKPLDNTLIRGITFDQVQGIDECKKDLEEIVDYLKNPEPFQDAGAKLPCGVLLVGEPGTGKTLLAKAIANEANVPFFHCNGSSFIEMFVGTGAKRVRDLFEEARKVQPSIVFIDEIDAIGRKRFSTTGNTGEYDQTINQLLVEMDGFDNKNSSVVVIGATNRLDILDDALIRPGRFDRIVDIALPTREGREKILEVHSANKKLDTTVSLSYIADQTVGFTGAELENLMNECAITAVKEAGGVITKKIAEDVYQRIVIGDISPHAFLQLDATKKRIAYHEAGHAVIGCLLPNYDLVRKVSIQSRGNAGGITFFQPKEDEMSLYTKEYFESQVKVLLAGYAIEELLYESEGVSLGASNDLLQVHSIVKDMVMCYGFNDFVGKLNLSDHKTLSPEMAFYIDSEIKRMVDCYYANTLVMLKQNMEYVEQVAKLLLRDNIIDGLDVYEIVGVYPFCSIGDDS